MKNATNEDMKEALQSILSMIKRSENAQEKFSQGTSQHALQKNRINALKISFSLIENALGNSKLYNFEKSDFEESISPINSLISKSEKSKIKLKQGTWQHTMLCNNLKALYIALPLLMEEIEK